MRNTNTSGRVLISEMMEVALTKQQKKTVWVISVLTVLIAPFLLIWLFNGTILRTPSPGRLRLIVTLFVPPNDLYEPLAEELLQIRKGETEVTFNFNHKYMGMHAISIFLENSQSLLFSKNARLELSADIGCYVKEKLLFSKKIKEGSLFSGQWGRGYILETYYVPQDLPLDELITCRATFSEKDSKFFREHGPAKLRANKLSDM